MAEKQPGGGPSLELPSFPRRRSRRPTTDPPPEPASAPRPRRQLPTVGGMPAAVITGAVVGVVIVGLTWSSLRLCELVRGTSSCGNPGFLVLLAIVVLAVLLGRLLLRTFGAADPGSTSLLGVGLVTVAALLFLVDLLFAWWMILVIPLVAMASYALAHWVTATFAEPASSDDLHR
jgi:hypothetical protein